MVVRALASDAQWPAELDAASSQLLVVDFFATWCGPCRTIAPFVEQLSNRYPDVVFLKVDVDKCPNTAQSAGVSAMPTFVFYVSRAKVDTLRGADQIDLTGFIMKESVECLNESDSFTLKHMLDGVCALKSDCDEQLLISLPLRQPVRLHSIAIRGAGDADAGAGAAGPRTIKIFCNTLQMLDFDAAEGAEPQQTVELETKHVDNGDVFNLRYVKFQNVHNVILFVRDNQDGSEVTEIGSIKLYGTPVQATNMSDFKRENEGS